MNDDATHGRRAAASSGAGTERAWCIRDGMLHAVRRFFRRRGFLEVTTPVRVPGPAPELHIDAEPAGEQFLRTSPELYLKRLVGAGLSRVYEMGPCFRRGERGRFHRPEYTMLEWYRHPGDYRAVLRDTRSLLRAIVRDTLGAASVTYGGQCIDLGAPWVVLPVAEAFRRHAGWDPVRAYDADRFDIDLVERVEPALPADRPCVLIDYPVEASALARLRQGNPPVAERWELYIGGLELANAYSELVDPEEQIARFQQTNRARQRGGRTAYPLDRDFLQAMETGLPDMGGVALGVDRLLMLLTNAKSIGEVLPF